MSDPSRLDRRRTPPRRRRRLLSLTAVGLGLSMAGGLGTALTATDRLGRILGVIVLFLSVTLLAPVVALWRLSRTDPW